MSEKFKVNSEEILSLEASFVKIPLETAKRINRRALKHAEKELNGIPATVLQFCDKSTKETSSGLETMVDRLRKLKRKMRDLKSEENVAVKRVVARVKHMKDLNLVRSLDSLEYKEWTEKNLQRMIVDHLMRNGQMETGLSAMESYKIEDFCDYEFHNQVQRIKQSLLKRQCTECLQWCQENKAQLKRIRSKLEFRLRLQEFVELAKQRNFKQCLDYANEHLRGYKDHASELFPVLALLAFPRETECEPYCGLYSDSKWLELADLFQAENWSINLMGPRTKLECTIQAGLAALKTSSCKPETKNISCPSCCTCVFQQMSDGLPLGHHVNSSYVCRITNTVMDENNPPMVTPDGYVYSLKAIKGPKFYCPRLKKEYNSQDLKKMFLT